MSVRLHLASASPRRLELLRDVGLDPLPCPTGIPENVRPREKPEEHVSRLAREKGLHALAGLGACGETGVVLAADTAVVLADEILGKPRDPLDAIRMLRRLSGRAHRVLTAVFVARVEDRRVAVAVAETRVTFRRLGEEEIARYVETGEPLDKAGAYGIQGLGAALVATVEGSYTNVVGLPLEVVERLVRELGAPWPGAGASP